MSVPFTDRRIESQPPSRLQFTLRGLFVFMFACAVYLSTFTTVARLVRPPDGPTNGVLISLLVDSAWLLFLVLYRKWGLSQASLVHWTGPALALCLTVLGGILALVRCVLEPQVFLDSLFDLFSAALWVPLVAFSYGAAVSTLVSFPISIVMMLYLGLSRPRPASHPRLGP